jgi:hypothetical protein
MGEADQSQTGKGYRNKLTTAAYRLSVQTVAQKKGGVGSLQETFDSKLIRGSLFVSLDNIKGMTDWPFLEMFLTEDTYPARVPHRESVDIDPTAAPRIRLVTLPGAVVADPSPNLRGGRTCCGLSTWHTWWNGMLRRQDGRSPPDQEPYIGPCRPGGGELP